MPSMKVMCRDGRPRWISGSNAAQVLEEASDEAHRFALASRRVAGVPGGRLVRFRGSPHSPHPQPRVGQYPGCSTRLRAR
jgi:hypothetical protein